MEKLENLGEDKTLNRAIIIFVLFIILNSMIISTTKVSGDSMYPSFNNGETRFMTKYDVGPSRIKNGDVVVFKSFSGEYFIKRVIARPGDIIEIRNNKVYVNKEEIKEEYTNEFYGMEDMNEIRIEKDETFVMGDNRDYSMDSRYFGPIKIGKILGKVLE